MKPADKILYKILLMIFAFASLASAYHLYSERDTVALTLVVESAGAAPMTIDITRLSSTMRGEPIVISNDLGFNSFTIEDGAVRMTSSDCAGGDCLASPAVGSAGGVIVCLPHKLVLRVVPERSFFGRPLDEISY